MSGHEIISPYILPLKLTLLYLGGGGGHILMSVLKGVMRSLASRKFHTESVNSNVNAVTNKRNV
jgi:hypothetical protein